MGECLTSVRDCPGRPGPHLNSPLSLSLPNLFRDSRHCLSFTAPAIAELSLSGTASSVCPPLLPSLRISPILVTKCRVQCYVARAGHAYIESQAQSRNRPGPGPHDMTTTHSLFDPFAKHVQPRMILVMSQPHPPINTFFTRGLFDTFTRVKCLHLTF